jgi:DNA-binding response OmpR family regulator
MNNEERRQEHRLLSFGSFRLDVRNQQLWRGQEVLRLTGKALAVLCYLVERSGQLLTRLGRLQWPEEKEEDKRGAEPYIEEGRASNASDSWGAEDYSAGAPALSDLIRASRRL